MTFFYNFAFGLPTAKELAPRVDRLFYKKVLLKFYLPLSNLAV